MSHGTAAASSSTAPLADRLLPELHAKFVVDLDKRKNTIEHWTMQHLRVSGIYWGMGAMHLLGKLDTMPREEIIDFTLKCRNSDGGFGGIAGHDSHMLYTLSSVQVLCMLGAEDMIDKAQTAQWVAARQDPVTGSFTGDQWGEVDTRFVYCALNCLSLLGHLHLANLEKAVDFTLTCENWDGGFGVAPGTESHAGQVFCSMAILSIANATHRINHDRLGWWLAERQLPSGGLNGRPEKTADVCYSWWVMSSLAMLRRLHWISRDDLFRYILQCQDVDDGGIADKPGNYADVYHTFFGLCGLSLLGYDHAELEEINPVYAMPPAVLKRLGIAPERGGDCPCRIDKQFTTSTSAPPVAATA